MFLAVLALPDMYSMFCILLFEHLRQSLLFFVLAFCSFFADGSNGSSGMEELPLERRDVRYCLLQRREDILAVSSLLLFLPQTFSFTSSVCLKCPGRCEAGNL